MTINSELEDRLGRVESFMLTTPPDPVDYYRHFVVTVGAIGRNGELIWLGIPRCEKHAQAGMLLVAWQRIREAGADAYGIAEVARDAQGMRRIFLYLVVADGPEHILTRTSVYQYGYGEDGVAQIVPLDQDDWILSDPVLLEPSVPTYWRLLGDMDEQHQDLARQLSEHRTQNGDLLFDVAGRYLEKQAANLRRRSAC